MRRAIWHGPLPQPPPARGGGELYAWYAGPNSQPGAASPASTLEYYDGWTISCTNASVVICLQ
jgi:hypothetical protein